MDKVKTFFKNYGMIMLMNLIIFILLFFGVGNLVQIIKPIFWRILFVLIIIIVTDIFYIFKRIKYEQVVFSLPVIFILNMIFINYCTLRDLFGITSHGSLDKSPAILDALLIDIIIVFVEYITLFITRFIINFIRKDIKEDNKKEVKKEEKVKEKADVKKEVNKTTKKGKINKK